MIDKLSITLTSCDFKIQSNIFNPKSYQATKYTSNPSLIINIYQAGQRIRQNTITLPSFSSFTPITNKFTLANPTFDSTVGNGILNLVSW